MAVVTVKVAPIDQRGQVDEGRSEEFTRNSNYVPNALRAAMGEAVKFMCEQNIDHERDAFDLTVSL